MNAKDRVRAIDAELLALRLERDGAWGTPQATPERREAIQQQIAALQRERQPLIQTVSKQQEVKAEGLLAVCLQHEIDHLNGVLFIDHISRLKRDIVVRKFRKMARDKPPARMVG